MRRKLYKYITLFVIILLALNPEAFQLAVFIDAVGIEVLFMLFEVQLISIVRVYYDKAMNIIVLPLHRSYVRFREFETLTFSTVYQATAMTSLVFCFAIFTYLGNY
jgi:hypothetical protein